MRRHISETLHLGMLLAAVGGFLDAYTYLSRGKVFANAQTGNLVLLGIRAFEGDWQTALHYVVPVCAFVLGVVLAESIRFRRDRFMTLHWRQLVLGVEIIVLAVAAFVPEQFNDMVNAAVSFVCAMQVNSFRTFEDNPYATTMCTGNLRSGTVQAPQEGEPSQRAGVFCRDPLLCQRGGHRRAADGERRHQNRIDPRGTAHRGCAGDV